jgi:hypothetical protein
MKFGRASKLLLAGLAAALCGCGGASAGGTNGATASCVSHPLLTTVEHPRVGSAPPVLHVTPGQHLRLLGYWYQACHDTNHQAAAAFLRLTIVVSQGRSRTDLATIGARQPGGTFDVQIYLPTTLHPGLATVQTLKKIEPPLRLVVRRR